MSIKLGITTIQRNRGPWIAEWIAFHYLVGFRKFYFYPHLCTDNTEGVLKNLQKNFDIKIFKFTPRSHNTQLECYQYSCGYFLKKVDWMAFLDSDEFLFPTSQNKIDMVLNEFADKPLSALGAYWSVFGSSGHIKEPKGLIIENYKRRSKDNFEANRHIKSIVRGKLLGINPRDPHLFSTPQGTFDENLRPITSGWTNYQPTYNKLRINHYTCQSREYFIKSKKDTRGPDGGDIRDEKWWEENDRNEIEDHSTDKFIKPLKEIMRSL
jgi:hypothetical protein